MSRHDSIVIAASAGGVPTLQKLVAALPADPAASLFIVMHLPASLPGALPSILSRSGPLPALHLLTSFSGSEQHCPLLSPHNGCDPG